MQRIGVLFVCLGNICRSPSAQAVLEDRLERRGLAPRFHVDSCGTAAFNVGKAPDPRAIAAAERRGYRIAHQRARQVDDADFARFRYIVAMDRANLHTLQGWATASFGGEIRLLMHFASGAATEVADPYYGSPEAFDVALDAIERGVDGLLLALCARHGTELATAARS
jgi:protein-tyrosine phosphatase